MERLIWSVFVVEVKLGKAAADLMSIATRGEGDVGASVCRDLQEELRGGIFDK